MNVRLPQFRWLWAILLFGCGGGGSGFQNPFAGTCLEVAYTCFQPSGTGTCQYNAASGVASLVFGNGSKVTSASGGTENNRCFGPSGSICFTVTKISDTVRNYQPTGQAAVTVTDDGSGTLQLQCSGIGVQTVAKPANNPAEQDLRGCVP